MATAAMGEKFDAAGADLALGEWTTASAACARPQQRRRTRTDRVAMGISTAKNFRTCRSDCAVSAKAKDWSSPFALTA